MIQSILISKDIPYKLAANWILENRFKLGKNENFDYTNHYYRFRQAPPKKGKRYYEIILNKYPKILLVMMY